MTFAQKQAAYKDIIDAALQEYFNDPNLPELLCRSMSYSIFAGGKRLRPGMLLAACEMIGGDIQDALPFACATEMIHTYSLIHDDLPAMDNDDVRRGQPTSHVVFGEGQAILAGDGLLSYAFEIVFDALIQKRSANSLSAAKVLAHGAGIFGMVKGQCLDLLQEGNTEVNSDILYAIHDGKTAAMLKASVEAGAMIAGATTEQISALCQFGEHYGLLFQITDDILDIEGSTQNMGKTIGKDIKVGKTTFPSIFGLDGAKRQADVSANKAIDALSIFGKSAWYFKELVHYTVNRKQ